MNKYKIGKWMMLGFCVVWLCACGQNGETDHREEDLAYEQTIVKGERWYDLPVTEKEREEAETSCKSAMKMIEEIYKNADKGQASNVFLSNETMTQMKEVLKTTGDPVMTTETYDTMENHMQMEHFLYDAEQGKEGTVVLYEISGDGGLARLKYTYDGENMYQLFIRMVWNDMLEPVITNISYAKIKNWKYTEKGWFGYELYVPEPPEVAEIVNGSCLIRVKPFTDEYRELSEKYVLPLGYQGNNILRSNWNTENLQDIDYNGLYEYLYRMKYQHAFDSEQLQYTNGIPAAEFENLIMEYLPVTASQIRQWAVFDEEHQTYVWGKLGGVDFAPSFLDTALPEVIHAEDNTDGTMTLTVDAVCDMLYYDDAVITHELTIRFLEDGSFQYLGNEILYDGIQKIPEYRYRCGTP